LILKNKTKKHGYFFRAFILQKKRQKAPGIGGILQKKFKKSKFFLKNILNWCI